jgi:protein TonB
MPSTARQASAKPRRSDTPTQPVVSALRTPVLQRLSRYAVPLGIGVSVIFHVLLMGTGFISQPDGLRKEHDPGLQIILVNARHKHAPKDAQALAQANLDGGGNTDIKDAMPESPLPPQNTTRDGDSLVASQKQVKQLEAEQQALLAKSKAADMSLRSDRPKTQSEQHDDTPPPLQGLDMTTAVEMARQEAKVNNGLREYAERPRKGVISPRTRQYRLAQYGEDWRIRVQRVGELNFPRGEQGSLYGSVQVTVELRPDGSVLSADISRPSPNSKLNDAALRIIKLGSPYATFPPDIRKDYDSLVLVRTLNFTREDIGITSQ